MTDVPIRDRGEPAAAAPEPPLDRAISPIAGRFAAGRAGRGLAFVGLLAGCGVFAAATWSADRPKSSRPPETPARQVVTFEPAKPPPTLAAPGPGAPSLTSRPAEAVPALAPSGEADRAPARPTGPSPVQAARQAPLMAYSRSGGGPADPLGAVAPASDRGPPTELDQLRRGSTIGRATAQRLGDRNFLILAGTTIPCILQTALDTATAGYVACVLPNDVYSDNGAVVLLEKGARVLGEYRSGMRQGQHRVFVLWTRAVTPNGVAIALASPASDALGRSGFDGAVDTHFWDRFGAALLLSVVDDGASAIVGHDNQTASVRLPSDAAALAVQGAADIPPTLRKAQGAEVAILAAQDFDFSGVYDLKARP